MTDTTVTDPDRRRFRYLGELRATLVIRVQARPATDASGHLGAGAAGTR